MVEFLTSTIQALVAQPEAVKVTRLASDTTVIYEVEVSQEDMGQVIGKQGKTANALRRLLTAVGAKQGEHAILEIIE